MQHSGLSSETAEFEADKFNLWELVCRSAWERRESWDIKTAATAAEDPLILHTSRYLHKNIFDHLIAVVVHADVTGEGLAKENISVQEMVRKHISNRCSTERSWHFPRIAPEVRNLHKMLVINPWRSGEILYELI